MTSLTCTRELFSRLLCKAVDSSMVDGQTAPRQVVLLLVVLATHCLLPGLALGQKLKAGVYVAARDLKGAAVVGTHQYLILVPADAKSFPDCKDLGDGTLGLVVGAHNRNDRLQVVSFDTGDWQATREHVNPDKYVSKFRPDYDTEVDGVKLSGKGVDETITMLLKAAKRYEEQEKANPIKYPGIDKQLKGEADCINSNSWAQSIIEHIVGKGVVKEDFAGADRCHQNRIDAKHFK